MDELKSVSAEEAQSKPLIHAQLLVSIKISYAICGILNSLSWNENLLNQWVLQVIGVSFNPEGLSKSITEEEDFLCTSAGLSAGRSKFISNASLKL